MPDGLVLRVDARGALVETDGRAAQAQLRGALFQEATWATRPVAVGDRVRLEGEGNDLTIAEILPRRNTLLRRASGEHPRAQVVASNLDLVAALGSLGKPTFSSTFVDRVLASATASDLPGFVVLTKIDLAGPGEVEAIADTYRRAGVETFPVSIKTGAGLEDLRLRLVSRATVVTGLSGVGKSSLLNALIAGLERKVGHLSSKWQQGKHTTASTELVHLPGGGDAIDTPGMRTFVPWGVHRASLRHCFPDLDPLLGRCRFADCSHTSEPGCHLRKAVERGELAPTRVASYLEILAEIEPPPEQWSEGARPEQPEEDDDEPDSGDSTD
jgi:ribosome biogenesis GTPase / thiamine phosphate phosphatase